MLYKKFFSQIGQESIPELFLKKRISLQELSQEI